MMAKKFFLIILSVGIILFFLPTKIKLTVSRYPILILMFPVNYLNNFISKIRVKTQELEKLSRLATEFMLENVRLKEELINLKQESIISTTQNLVWAKVIGRDQETFVRYLVINKGSAHKIKKDLPVITPYGLVGKVLDCNPLNAIVETALSPQLRISALNLRSNVVGVIEYDQNQLLRFKYSFAESDVLPGDTIITSGLGGIFPRGLKIGVVTKVTPDRTRFFQHVEVLPVNNFNTIEYVLVLLEEFASQKINVPQEKAKKIQEIQIEIPTQPRIR
ncbi:MAG: rod shape-determining protein MreC [candidate division WOR-3 bacterium]|nr:rod shape-determining protein MreC [candidate division WOR-3 bacterium]MCX7757061.1 rod shape-determining protein MreC [candidate division WOR-3 bacterium]MDW7987240.1 rod shape-determining protein MreC [candidate division WOR-3 bacterium]